MATTTITWEIHNSLDHRAAIDRLMLAMTRASLATDAVAVATLSKGVDTTLNALAAHWEAIATTGGH